jgi:hypothetical protein
MEVSMTRTISRLFHDHAEAIAAVEDLEAAGVSSQAISIVSHNGDNWHQGHHHPNHAEGDEVNHAADGAAEGGTVGAIVGGGAGLLAGLGALAIPGVGPVVAAGWVTATALGVAAGAVAGAATGGILGALKDAGHSADEAEVFAEGIRRGGTLVSVKAHEDQVGHVEATLRNHAGKEATAQGKLYRAEGWTGFDVGAPNYTADEIAAERARYGVQGEPRSFIGDDAARFDAKLADEREPLNPPPEPRPRP